MEQGASRALPQQPYVLTDQYLGYHSLNIWNIVLIVPMCDHVIKLLPLEYESDVCHLQAWALNLCSSLFYPLLMNWNLDILPPGFDQADQDNVLEDGRVAQWKKSGFLNSCKEQRHQLT